MIVPTPRSPAANAKKDVAVLERYFSMCFFLRCVAFFFCCAVPVKSALDIYTTNLLITSASSWMVFSPNHRQSYFNKLGVSSYGRLFSVKTVISVPLAWTVHVRPEENKMRCFPGDFDIYFAHKIGWIEPRAGIDIPLGYGLDDNWKRKAWIGSNNVRLQAGFAVSRADFEQIGLPFGLETNLSVALTDDNAWYARGSMTGRLYLKSSRRLSKKATLGGEMALYGRSSVWKWNRSKEQGMTVLPTVSYNYRLGKRYYLGIKTGCGPSFSIDDRTLHYKSISCDAGISLQYYP
jgi:hypothetical protein